MDPRRFHRSDVRHHEAVRPAAASRRATAAVWGSEDHVRELFGDRVERVHTETGALRVTHHATPEAFRDYFKTNYGPTIVAYRGLSDDPDRAQQLDRDLTDLARRFDLGTDSTTVLDWEYLLFIARKSG
jgi:hypothetical protein